MEHLPNECARTGLTPHQLLQPGLSAFSSGGDHSQLSQLGSFERSLTHDILEIQFIPLQEFHFSILGATRNYEKRLT